MEVYWIKPKLLIIVLCFTVLISALSAPIFALELNESSVSEYTIDYYEYPLTVESPDWFKYTVLEKVEMLRIPEEILDRMSDEALIQAIIDFPYLGDLYAYEFDRIERLSKYCSALNELLTRSSGLSSLKSFNTRAIALTSGNTPSISSLGYDKNYLVAHAITDIIIDVQINSILDSPLIQRAAAPVTPNGTTLPPQAYSTPTETHVSGSSNPYYHTNMDAYYVNTFGVTKVSGGSCKYNCHSYAWHSQSTSNIYWITNPSYYWTDYSYTLHYSGSSSATIYSANLRNGDKVVYGPSGNNSHSAILYGNTNFTSLNSIATIKCISKWGPQGVFIHTLGNVPADYISSTVRIYR